MSKSNLLIDETPIVFQPTLAKLIGLPEAIVLQTLKFWCGQKRSGKVVDDERWIFNTLEQWREFSFPFWSTRTIGEVFRTLESMGLVKSKQFDLQSGKAMKYYTISQSALTILTSERADHLEDSSTSIWKILPDHLEDSSRSARARHIKQYTEKQTENTKPLTPFQGEEESSAVASHSSVELNQPNLFPTNPNEANASGSANAKLNSADGKETAPHCAAPPQIIPPELNTPEFNESWNEFIQHRKEKKIPMTPTAKKNMFRKFAAWGVDNAIQAIDTAISNGWTGVFEVKPSKFNPNLKPERFSNF
jgi:hypothetical protein